MSTNQVEHQSLGLFIFTKWATECNVKWDIPLCIMKQLANVFESSSPYPAISVAIEVLKREQLTLIAQFDRPGKRLPTISAFDNSQLCGFGWHEQILWTKFLRVKNKNNRNIWRFNNGLILNMLLRCLLTPPQARFRKCNQILQPLFPLLDPFKKYAFDSTHFFWTYLLCRWRSYSFTCVCLLLPSFYQDWLISFFCFFTWS